MSRGWLSPLSPLYGAVVAAKNTAYERRWLKAKRLQWPVVSVGNLSVGGAGKTPLTIRLAELLLAQGFPVDVLSRGYGRCSSTVERVDPEGDAARFGDEPLLIARRSGVPVYVGASRLAAGALAEKQGSASVGMTNFVQPEESRSQTQNIGRPKLRKPVDLSLPPFDKERGRMGYPDLGKSREDDGTLPTIHLLDDGFQHRGLFRNVDVVVLHRSDLSERRLPAGRLREPLSAVRRADFVVLREEDDEFEEELRRLESTAPIWWMRRSLELADDLTSTLERVVGFCGIARSEEFFAGLTRLGVNLEVTVAFTDHHRYSRDDMERLAKTARQVRAEAFVTTEKDFVRLDAELVEILERMAPLRVARLAVSLRDEALVVEQLLAKLPSAG